MLKSLISCIGLAMLAQTAWSAELKVFCPGAVRGVVTELAVTFQHATGHSVKFEYGTAGAVAKRVGAGEAGDVAITTAGSLTGLQEQGFISTGSKRDLGAVGVAVAVRSGAPLPDVSTPETFKKTMLEAKSVMYADSALGGQSGIHTAKVFETLGIADAMKPKTMLRPGAPQGLVAKGEIELGIGQMSEIVAAKGVQLVGPLPASLQNTLVFSAGIVANTQNAEAARAFIAHLATAAAREQFKAAGFGPPQ